MSKLTSLRDKVAKAWPFQVIPGAAWSAQQPTYQDANPAVIRAALSRALRRPGGNWFVFAASTQITTKAFAATVAGHQLVAWRGSSGALLVAPRACPHLGADLSCAPVEGGTLVCPWHGLRFGAHRQAAGSRTPPTTTVCCAGFALTPSRRRRPRPTPRRPAAARASRAGGGDPPGRGLRPRDIVANRLDPWHGAWFHPYSFTQLNVLSAPPAVDYLPDEKDRFLVSSHSASAGSAYP